MQITIKTFPDIVPLSVACGSRLLLDWMWSHIDGIDKILDTSFKVRIKVLL